MGINGLPNVSKLLTEEFIDGIKSGSKKRSEEEIAASKKLAKKMVDYYQWNTTKSIFGISSQKCADMIIHIGTKLFQN